MAPKEREIFMAQIRYFAKDMTNKTDRVKNSSLYDSTEKMYADRYSPLSYKDQWVFSSGFCF